MLAQAWGTPESADLLPGMTAQPPFSTKVACCHELVFFNSARFVAASALSLELIDADRRDRRDHGAVGGGVPPILRGSP